MNRRKFLEFLGKAAAVGGIAVVSGLPTVNDPNVPVEFEDSELYEDGTICSSGLDLPVGEIAKWNGNAWKLSEEPIVPLIIE